MPRRPSLRGVWKLNARSSDELDRKKDREMLRSPLIDFGVRDPITVDKRLDLSEFEWCVDYCAKNSLSAYDPQSWEMAKAEFKELQK